jgi:hypothetical protein
VSRVDLWLTIRGSRLLLRGWEAQRAARYICCDNQLCQIDTTSPVDCRPAWSLQLADGSSPSPTWLRLAYAQSHRLLAVVSDITDRKTA